MNLRIARLCLSISTLALFSTALSSEASGAQRVFQDGLTRYTIVLKDEAVEAADGSHEAPALNVRDPRAKTDVYAIHKPKTRALVKQLETEYGVRTLSMTSYTVPRFTAFMTDAVADALRSDPRVRNVGAALADSTTYSSHTAAPPLWADTVLGAEEFPWGVKAVRGDLLGNVSDTGGLNRQQVVYMIDAPAVMSRQANGTYVNHPDVDVYVLPVGAAYNSIFLGQWNNPNNYLNPHGMHVAGVLGARVNSAAVRGVWPGVQIINVIRGNSSDEIQNSIEITRLDIVQNMPGQFAVVNISSNSPNFALNPDDPTFGASSYWDDINALRSVAFVAQSAGNHATGACGHSWNAHGLTWDASSRAPGHLPHRDGVMVIGGIDNLGKHVGPQSVFATPVHSMFNSAYPASPTGGYQGVTPVEEGTNIGTCVEAWAPAYDVKSIWNSGPAYPDPQKLSGTSFSSAHVAALAAEICRDIPTPTQPGLTKPMVCESRIRNRLFSWGEVDQAGNPIRMPTWDGAASTTVSRLAQVSTRAKVVQGEPVIAGFVIEGTKQLAIVATGPSLSAYGITNPLANPTITIVNSAQQIVASNDNWQSDVNQSALSSLGLAPANPNEAAVLRLLPAGAYTVIVQGVNGGTGTTVVAVYETGQPEVRIQNLSTRAWVDQANPIIAGFQVLGPKNRAAMLVGAGPSLAGILPNALSNPKMTLTDPGTGQVLWINDDWANDTAWFNISRSEAIASSELRPGHPQEPAILYNFPANKVYTAIVEGVNGAAGVAVVGIYEY